MSSAVADIHADALPGLPGRARARASTSLATGALLKTQSDARLCRLTSEGYEAAFEALVGRHRSPLHRYARRFLTDAPAEDVVQQAFMDLWAALSDGEQIRNVRAWLYRVVRNGALNTIRRAAYRHDELQEAPDADSPELAYERTSAVRDALDGLASLPALQREAIVRSAVDGHSRGEIGTAMGLSDGAVGMLLYRARSTLRCAMSAIVPFPLVIRAAGRSHDPSAAARILQLTAAGADSGPALSVLLRGGATLAVIAATAAPLVAPHARRHSDAAAHSAVPAAASALIGGASDPLEPFVRPRPAVAPGVPAAGTAAQDRHISAAPATASVSDTPASVEDPPAEAAASPPPEGSAPAEASAETAEAPPAPAAEPSPSPEAAPAERAPPAEPEAAAPPSETPPSAP